MHFSDNIAKKFLTAGVDIGLLEGCCEEYNGTGIDLNDKHARFEGDPCFMSWEDWFMDEYDFDSYDALQSDLCGWQELTYEHRVNDVLFPDDLQDLYRYGWDEVLQPVFKLMPRFDELTTRDNPLVADCTQMPYCEINHNWRMVRAFNEHPELVTSCAWVRHLYPRIPAPVAIVAAAWRWIGPGGVMGMTSGNPHSSMTCDGNFGAITTMVRALTYQQRNGGVLWGPKFVDVNKGVTVMGVNRELHSGTSGRFNLKFPKYLGPMSAYPNTGLGPVPRLEKLGGLQHLETMVQYLWGVWRKTRQYPAGTTMPLGSLLDEGDIKVNLRNQLRPY